MNSLPLDEVLNLCLEDLGHWIILSLGRQEVTPNLKFSLLDLTFVLQLWIFPHLPYHHAMSSLTWFLVTHHHLCHITNFAMSSPICHVITVHCCHVIISLPNYHLYTTSSSIWNIITFLPYHLNNQALIFDNFLEQMLVNLSKVSCFLKCQG